MENKAKSLQLNLSPEVKKAMQSVKKFVEDAKFSLPIPTFKLPQIRLLTQDDISYIEKLIREKGVQAVKRSGKILEARLNLHPGTITEESFCDFIYLHCSVRQIDEMKISDTGKLLAKYIIELTKETDKNIEEAQGIQDIQSDKTNFSRYSLTENKFIPVIQIKIVETYFAKELIEKKYITGDQLNEFLYYAFQMCKPLRERIQLQGNHTKARIIKIFYSFWKTVEKPKGRKREFCALLGENFLGFDTKQVYANFRD